MNLDFNISNEQEFDIKVIGVGGGGTNAVNHMLNKGIVGVNFIVCNTDEQHLKISPVKSQVLLGEKLTKGRGTGDDPEVGKLATEESIDLLKEKIGNNAQMVFVTAGMGKGTGTGGAPIVAKMSKELGLLTIAIVTTPFEMLGKKAVEKANNGIAELKKHVDSIIIISNDKILEMYSDCEEDEAFAYADDVLLTAAKGISEIITNVGTRNTDFADVRKVLANGGITIMGSGYSSGENRAIDAVNNALNSPLLNNGNIKGAKRALVNISSSPMNGVKMKETQQIINAVKNAAGDEIEIIYGSVKDDTLDTEIGVTLVVTGFENYVETIEKTEIATVQNEIIEDTQMLEEDTNNIMLNFDQKESFEKNQEIELSYENNNYELNFDDLNINKENQLINYNNNINNDSPKKNVELLMNYSTKFNRDIDLELEHSNNQKAFGFDPIDDYTNKTINSFSGEINKDLYKAEID